MSYSEISTVIGSYNNLIFVGSGYPIHSNGGQKCLREEAKFA
jgi:hypothetical protein